MSALNSAYDANDGLDANLSLDELEQLLGDLDAMTLEQLRQVWRERFGQPPRLRSPDTLRHLIGWRLQTEAFGGLSLETRNALKARAPVRTSRLSDGAKLSREWKGRRYDVERTSDGFIYDGARYRSLSEVARVITGVRWNGPRFFGLRKEAA
jgi:hypothetical protein